MNNSLISCLTATYGRYSRLTEAVNCFINQDYKNKELIILNNHPVPLFTELPQVKIYNEPKYPTLGDCRNRLLELANGEYMQIFDDDDAYAPQTLRFGIENIKNYTAWKPSRSWFWQKNKPLELTGNTFEASILIKTEFVRKIGYKKSMGDESKYIIAELSKNNLLKERDLGLQSPYIYRWGWGEWHASGSLGNGTVEERTKSWIEHNQDIGDQVIKKINLDLFWKTFENLKIEWYNKHYV